MTEAARVAVVGLGAMGAATLYQLAKRGIPALGIDRHDPPHAHGSSHGETRITRQAIGEGAEYVPLVLRSHEIWRELERATGAELFVRCGGVVIGPPDDARGLHDTPGFLRSTIAQARRFGIAHELLDRRQAADRFPQFTGLANDDIVYHEPGAGFVRPEACIKAQLDRAIQLGARVRTGTNVLALQPDGDAMRIETDTETIRVARVVVAAGAWTGGLVGPPFDRLLRVTRQSLFWFQPDEPTLYDVGAGCPVFIRQHGPTDEDLFYGFPTPAGSTGVKLATERDDDELAADDYEAGPASTDAAAFYEKHVAGYLRGVTPRVVKSLSCLYTSTPGSRFLIDEHPRMPHVTVVSACSGHGFKHSAALGELVAERVRGAMLLGPFRLSTHPAG